MQVRYKVNKKALFKIHSWIGINLSIIFFLVCFSGSIATISNELDWLFNSEIRATPSTNRVSHNTIAKKIKDSYPDAQILYWPAEEAAYLCQVVHLEIDGKRKYVFVNPYNGNVQGLANITIQRFFRDFHYFLFLPIYQIGYFIVLVFAFMLFIALATALIFYKKWWMKWTDLKKSKGTLVLLRSLHRLVGIWSIPFVLIFSLTGIWYFLERTNIASISTIANPKNPTIQFENNIPEPIDSYGIDYDSAILVAKIAIPNLVIKDILPPKTNLQPLYITGKSEVPLVRNRANRVYLNPTNYEVIKVQRADQLDNITYLNDIADPVHFGYWGGIITKLIYFVTGMGITSLILTGIWIALKRQIINGKKIYYGWKWINYIVVLAATIGMYVMLYQQYDTDIQTYLVITLGLLTFLITGWYIFGIRIYMNDKSRSIF